MPKGLFPNTPLPEELFMVTVQEPGGPKLYVEANMIIASLNIAKAGLWPEAVARSTCKKITQEIQTAQEPHWVGVKPLGKSQAL